MHQILKLSVVLLGITNPSLCFETHAHANEVAAESLRSSDSTRVLKNAKPPKVPKNQKTAKTPKAPKSNKAFQAPKAPKGPEDSKKSKKVKGFKFNETFSITYIVYSSKGFDADAISKSSAAQGILANALKLTLADSYNAIQPNRRKLNTAVGDVTFTSATSALSTSTFSTVQFSAVIASQDSKNESEVQIDVNNKASDGIVTKFLEQSDPPDIYGFSATGSIKSAVYSNVLRFRYECNETTNIKDGLDTALRRWHKLVNIRANQGFKNISIVGLNVTTSACVQSRRYRVLGEQNVRVLRGDKEELSLVNWKQIVKCSGICPDQSQPDVDTNNRRRRLEDYFPEVSDEILFEEDLKRIVAEETKVPILNVTTDEDQNKLIGCLLNVVSLVDEGLEAVGVHQCTNPPTASPTGIPSSPPTPPPFWPEEN